jgi:hypothetical protein
MSIDQFYKPGSISPPEASGLVPPNPGGHIYNDLNPGSSYDPIPAGTTIIDQATFLNAQLPDPNFVPTEYIATQNATNDITHLDIGVSNMYGGGGEGYRIGNTDNMIALTHPTLGVGVNVYDPSAIMSGIDLYNGHGFSVLAASVMSILDASRYRTLSIAFRSAGAKMSTTERNASTPRNGWIIYNSTSHTFQGYADGAWIDLH